MTFVHSAVRIAAMAGVLLGALSWAPIALSQTRVRVTKDNSIVLVENERQINAGGNPRPRIKGNQHLLALALDTDALEGKRVESATLVYYQDRHAIDGVTVSTIQAPWDEGRSNALTGGVSEKPGWAWPGSQFPAVTGGNGFSLLCQAKSVLEKGAYRWEVDPDLIHANAIGAAYGLTLHEFAVDYSRNPTVFSREQRAEGRRPYLLVTFGGREPAPQPPRQLKIVSDGGPEDVRLSFLAPREGFAYDVEVNGSPLPRWNIPFVEPGREQTIRIRDVPLTGGERLTITVTALNRTGQRSKTVSVTAQVPERRALDFPDVPAVVGRSRADDRTIAVIPLLDKYDAAGQPVGELPADYRRRNAVFDGETIRLKAARGEVVGFQALLRGSRRGRATVRCELGGLRVDLWRAVYVDCDGRQIPDPLVPLDSDGVELSTDRETPLCVDVFVPFDFKKRVVEGSLRLSDGRQVPIRLEVRDFAIPREANFLCEMNGYGVPRTVSEFYRLQEIAYDHRLHVNLLHYSHRSAAPGARKCTLDMILDSGRRMDEKRYNAIRPGAQRAYWDDFIAAFDGYLSGKHFRDGHRGPIPAPGFYLTFHESWPLNVRAHFNGNPDAYEAFKDQPLYAQTFENILRDFVSVAKRRGWTKTGFQIYLNNKGTLEDETKSPWILDEPRSYWDYRALAYYGDLVRKVDPQRAGVEIRYRIDISRPQYCRGQLAGKTDLWVVNSRAFREYRRLVADRHERSGEDIWLYGSTNRVETSNRSTPAWVLEAYLNGVTGVVPWQTIDKRGRAMQRGDPLGLFIFAPDRARRSDRSGNPTIHHSLRLKAYRRAQQDVEYLRLAKEKQKLTDTQLRTFVDHYIDLTGELERGGADQAPTASYQKLEPDGFRRMREAAAEWIEGGR